MPSARRGLVVALLVAAGCRHTPSPPPLPECDRTAAPFRLTLHDDWRLRSSADVGADPVTLSTLGYDPSRWYPTTVPATVSGTLAQAGAAGGDPFFGMNLRNLPSMDYPIGAGFGDYDLDDHSAVAVPWWYRTEFTLPSGFAGERVWLRLEGVSYRAQIWLNGR
ncbi:MAG: glycosyl hydrolase 2 galactose-binding domain-containing protein, partial [Polyangia bacterium]